jgi:SAM-dependent methyltransferase
MSRDFSQIPIERVRDFWNARPCNIRHSPKPVGSKEYFEEVRERKYFVEPHIPAFAEFERWRGKRVLEIGCGIGTDTISFASAGAHVTAVDLSSKSLEIARQRAAVYGFTDRIDFVLADAMRLNEFISEQPYDLIYSFGVIHHTPDPARVIQQARKFAAPNTVLKLMLYHRYSWKALSVLATHGLGRFWRFDEFVARYSQAQIGNPVTYSFSGRSARHLLEQNRFRVTDMFVTHIFPYRVGDYLDYQYVKKWHFRAMPETVFAWLESVLGWHLCITAKTSEVALPES